MTPRLSLRQPRAGVSGLAVAGLAAAGLFVAGCGSSSSSGSSSGTSTSAGSTATSSGGTATTSGSSSVDTAAAAMVPASIKKSGITVGMFTGAPPEAYVNSSNQLVGFDPDIIRAVGKVLGVTINLKQTSFENAMLGLQSGNVQITPGASVTPARLKVDDFVGYVDAGYTTAQKSGSAKYASSMTALCGQKVATLSDVSFLPLLTSTSKKCTAAGKGAITTLTYPDWGTAELAVQSGRADTVAAPAATLSLLLKQQTGKWQVTGPVFAKEFGGYALKKGSPLVKPLAAAIDALIKDGTYNKILKKYGVPENAIKQAKIFTGS
jgi:polar amino acid transport system substrate-binding protein